MTVLPLINILLIIRLNTYTSIVDKNSKVLQYVKVLNILVILITNRKVWCKSDTTKPTTET